MVSPEAYSKKKFTNLLIVLTRTTSFIGIDEDPNVVDQEEVWAG